MEFAIEQSERLARDIYSFFSSSFSVVCLTYITNHLAQT